MAPLQTVLLMYGNGGGGHAATAHALRAALAAPPSPPLDVEAVDAAALSGAAAGDGLYNLLLSYNAVSAIDLMHAAIQFFWPLARPRLLTTFRAYWRRRPALAVVVSCIPMLNAVFAQTLPPHVRLLTVMTDFSHTDSHPWIQHPRQHLVTGTAVSFAQALAHGYVAYPHMPPSATQSPSMLCTNTSGMVVHPKFYNRVDALARARRKADIGLHPDLPTVLVLYGGSPPTDRVTHIVDAFLARPPQDRVNIIAVCARNRYLLQRLNRRKDTHPDNHLFLTGFSDEIPLLMQISDILIGKPGPGVVTEAFVSGLPSVLVTGADECNVMKQERDVLDWVRQAAIAVVVKTSAEAASVSVAKMKAMRQHIDNMPRNTSVFEVRRLILSAMGLHDDEQLPAPPTSPTDTIPNTDASSDEKIPQIDLSDFATATTLMRDTCTDEPTGEPDSTVKDSTLPTNVQQFPGPSSAPKTHIQPGSNAPAVR